ncbi:WYL domain-containing protein [Marinospirillum perlucidum]|uniref:WYL domain-containing protein n=1 Tax=Marinospirillum perlucidum TaxID=1982602 RepID=UPI000DF1F96D|nr:WYL domain-containing protein [Marinospirillum perlucidum]
MLNTEDQRDWLLELLAWWAGQITPSQLAEHWQVSRQHASQLLKRYISAYPDNLAYDPASQTYHPTSTFQPLQINLDAHEYLNWATGLNHPQPQPVPPHLAHEILQQPRRRITPQILRPLIQALRENRRLDVDYFSLANPDDQGRNIVPHHFVHNGQRWHLRAWCEKSQIFKDFVLSRFSGQPELLDTSHVTPDQDVAWNTQITLILQPDPRLNPKQKRLLEEEYLMENGQLQLTTRACLANYLLKNLQIHPRILEGEPEAQQLVLVNKNDIKPWLFG